MKNSTSFFEAQLLEKGKMIIQLIIDDMTHYKLLLESARKGIDTSTYQTMTCNVIFSLCYIPEKKQTEALKDWYNRQTERALTVEMADLKQFHKIATDILLGLINWKEAETNP